MLPIRKRIEKYVHPQTANFWCHIADGAFISLGMGIVGAGGVFQAIAEKLGASATFMGGLNAIAGFGVLAPLIFAPMVEAAARRKRIVLLLGLGQRMPFLVIPFALLAFATTRPYLCLVIIAFVRLAAGMMVSALVPPWTDLLAETIPRHKVGRLFGYREVLGSIVVLVAGPMSAVIVAAWAFPYNFAALYLIAFLAVAISWIAFTLVDEVASGTPVRGGKPAFSYFRELLSAVKEDKAYRWFLVYRAMNRVGFAVTAFYTFAVLRYYGVSRPFAVGMAMTAPPAAKIVGNIGFARVADRIGYKHTMEISSALSAAAAVLAALAPDGRWYVAVFFVSGLAMAAGTVSGTPFLMSVAPGGRRIGYITLSMVIMAPVGIVAAYYAGYLMDAFGHRALFLAAAAVVLAAVIPLEHCRPSIKHEPELEAAPEDEG